MRKLVIFGYYATETKVESLVTKLVNILNGKDDLLLEDGSGATEHWSTEGRFESTEDNLKIFTIKARIIRILHYFVNHSVSKQLEVCLFS